MGNLACDDELSTASLREKLGSFSFFTDEFRVPLESVADKSDVVR